MESGDARVEQIVVKVDEDVDPNDETDQTVENLITGSHSSLTTNDEEVLNESGDDLVGTEDENSGTEYSEDFEMELSDRYTMALYTLLIYSMAIIAVPLCVFFSSRVILQDTLCLSPSVVDVYSAIIAVITVYALLATLIKKAWNEEVTEMSAKKDQ